MSLLLLLGDGGGAATNAGSISYVGWWIGGMGSVPDAGAADPQHGFLLLLKVGR